MSNDQESGEPHHVEDSEAADAAGFLPMAGNGLLGAVVAAVLGVVLHVLFGAKAAFCASGIGAIGQSIGGTGAQVECGAVTIADTIGTSLLWLAGVIAAIAVLIVLLNLRHLPALWSEIRRQRPGR